MSHQQDMALMHALTDAHELVSKLRIEVCSNPYAWRKLHRVRSYLEEQQRALGRRMFDEPEAETTEMQAEGAAS